VLPQRRLTAEQRQLLRWFDSLGGQDRASLLAFAQFLASREAAADASDPVVAEPRPIARPDQESVVAAIKRLSSSYFMLDTRAMLNDTASLMSAHLLQGRRAAEVIDDLEDLFLEHYRRYCSPDSGSPRSQ
jgi:hypothetical protein